MMLWSVKSLSVKILCRSHRKRLFRSHIVTVAWSGDQSDNKTMAQENITQISRESVSLIEVLDRVLDKGIVIDAWIGVSVIGIELVTIEARVIVASLETYVRYAPALKAVGPVAGGQRQRKSLKEGLREVEEALEGAPLAGELAGGEEGREKEGRSARSRPQKRRTAASKK